MKDLYILFTKTRGMVPNVGYPASIAECTEDLMTTQNLYVTLKRPVTIMPDPNPQNAAKGGMVISQWPGGEEIRFPLAAALFWSVLNDPNLEKTYMQWTSGIDLSAAPAANGDVIPPPVNSRPRGK